MLVGDGHQAGKPVQVFVPGGGVVHAGVARVAMKPISDLGEGGIVLRSLPEGIDIGLITASWLTTIWA